MPPTPPSTTSSSNGHSPDAHFRVVRKRNRVPLSCGPCRHRKLKCDRGHPCENCKRRGDMASCAYATPGSRKKSSSSQGTSNSPDEMQNRIDRLEGLVLSLMTNGAQSAGPAAAVAAVADANSSSLCGSSPENALDVDGPQAVKEEGEGEESEVDQVAKSIGVMKVDNGKAIFASEAHWYAILAEVSEVKNYFTEHKKQYEEQLQRYMANNCDDDAASTTLLFGPHNRMSSADVRAAFPPKSTVDLLVTRYFNTYDPAIHIIHGPTFQKQYDQHWVNPNETPIIWLGLVFAMMCIAVQSYTRVGDEPPEYKSRTAELAREFRLMTSQCLVIADIRSPIPHMLETLILHVYADYSKSRDAETSVQVGIGVIARLAIRMGYHRDPAPYQNISPFLGEMRRRIWTAVRCLDILFAAQAGMPPIIRARHTNTQIPRNVYDDELYEELTTLPPSRPLTEATPTAYMIAKARLVYLYGEIVEESLALTCTPYEDIMKLDQRLRELQTAIPPHLRMRSIEESQRDSASLVMQRYTLDLLYLRSICVLHRKFLACSRQNPRFAYSRRSAIDASMTMLQHQAAIHNESTRPGGKLKSVKWFISSLTAHDFLLAAMIVCLDLYHTAEAESKGRTSPSDAFVWSHDRRDEMIAALTRATMIWDGLKDNSMEAYKAHASLSVMLDKLKSHQAMRQAQQNFASSFPASTALEDPNVAPEHSAAMTLGMLSTGALTPNTANMFDKPYPASMGNILNDVSQPPGVVSSQPPYAGADLNGPASPTSFSLLFGSGFQNMDLPAATGTSNVDWDAWDSYIQGTTLDPTNQMWPMDMPNMSTVTMADASAAATPTGMNGITPSSSSPSHQQPQSQSQSQPPPHSPMHNVFTGNTSNNIFMGVSTPPPIAPLTAQRGNGAGGGGGGAGAGGGGGMM